MREPLKAHQGKIVYDTQEQATPVGNTTGQLGSVTGQLGQGNLFSGNATGVGQAQAALIAAERQKMLNQGFQQSQAFKDIQSKFQGQADAARNQMQQNPAFMNYQAQQKALGEAYEQSDFFKNMQQQQQTMQDNYRKEIEEARKQFTGGFSKGGANMERQMNLFEQGGMKDDGLDRDPISGNNIPPGSLAKEVRDDVPAQLSEGEYVVPADVVQYFGVKFFEDLRMEAKAGLSQMDRDGRIGGEPVEVDMTMIAFGKKDKKDKNKKANGGVIYANEGVATIPPEAEAINKSGTFKGSDYSVIGFTPNSPVYQTGKGSSQPANNTKQVTYYHSQTGEAKVVTFVNGIVTPPSDLKFTQPPWSVNKPTQTQQQTGGGSDKDKKKTEPKVPQYLKDVDFTTWKGSNYMDEATNALKRDMGENFFGAFATLALGPAGLLVNEMIDIDGISKASLMADAALKAGFEEEADRINQQIQDHLENESTFATRNFLKTELGQKVLRGSKTRIADALNKSNKSWASIGSGTNNVDPPKGNLTSSQKASRDYYDDERRGSNTITGKTYVNEDGGTSKTEDFGKGRVTTVKTKSDTNYAAKENFEKSKKSAESLAEANKDYSNDDYYVGNKGGLLKRRTNKKK